MKNQNTKKSTWLTQIKEMLSEKSSGQFASKDSSGAPIVLEWKITDILSSDLALFKNDVSEVAAQTTAAMEVQFLHEHPEAVSSEYFLKSCEPFFKNGLESVDWQHVEQTIQATVKQFYLTDISMFGEAIKPLLDDVYGFVTVKNQNAQAILGFIMFSITPALAEGNVKVIHVAITPTAERRGLDKLLIGSIFKILPATKRIFIGTRPTHEHALKEYCSWGFLQDFAFTQDQGHIVNLQYFAVYEYLAEQTDVLQKTAAGLLEQVNNKTELKSKGTFIAHDKNGTKVLLEWQETNLVAPEFATATKTVWELTRKAFIPVEMQFLRAHPEVVGTEDYYKPFEPMFKNGLSSVDWVKTEEIMHDLIKSYQFFDASTLPAEVIAMYAEDVYYFVTIKDQQTNGLLGYISFMVRSNYVKGVMSIAVDPAHQNCGLGKLLMSSILKIRPDIERFFLNTRVTNDTARNAYLAWGFTNDENPAIDHALNPNHWIFFKYEFNKTNILQKAAAELKIV